MEDISGAKTILLVGSNAAETMPPIMQYFGGQQEAGGRLIVADPRSTPTAQKADLHLQLTPGTDAALANGLLHVMIVESLIDEDYIRGRAKDFELAKASAGSYWPGRVERITGVPEMQIVRAARMLGESRSSAMILTARGAEQQAQGVNNMLSYINIALALGLVGRPNSGYGCLTGQGNGQGGRDIFGSAIHKQARAGFGSGNRGCGRQCRGSRVRVSVQDRVSGDAPSAAVHWVDSDSGVGAGVSGTVLGQPRGRGAARG